MGLVPRSSGEWSSALFCPVMYAVVFSEEVVSVHKLGYEDGVWRFSRVLLCLRHRWVEEWEILPWLGWLIDHTKCVMEFSFGTSIIALDCCCAGMCCCAELGCDELCDVVPGGDVKW